MTAQVDARKRSEALKHLREQHKDGVERTQALLKQQQAVRRQISQSLRDGAKTVPDLAAATGLPADQVLWYITAMKKYNLIEETGMDGDYYRYQLPQEAKS